LTEAHSVWKELHAMKQALWVQGAGLHGLFSPDPDEILESPTDKSSRLAYFMREAAQAGFCKELAQ
jgi:hypothetical protein